MTLWKDIKRKKSKIQKDYGALIPGRPGELVQRKAEGLFSEPTACAHYIEELLSSGNTYRKVMTDASVNGKGKSYKLERRVQKRNTTKWQATSEKQNQQLVYNAL